jgi:hypothetical protein
LCEITNGWVALAALTVFVLFTALVLPGQATSTKEGTGDAGSPDLSLWYSPRELYRMAEAYGQEGRRAYVRARFTFDLVWPAVYGAFLAFTISWLFARAFPAGSAWRLANLVPLLAVLFDLLENVSTSLVMLRYPSRTPGIDALAPAFTLVKWCFVGGSFLLLIAGVAIAVGQAVRKRRQ